MFLWRFSPSSLEGMRMDAEPELNGMFITAKVMYCQQPKRAPHHHESMTKGISAMREHLSQRHFVLGVVVSSPAMRIHGCHIGLHSGRNVPFVYTFLFFFKAFFMLSRLTCCGTHSVRLLPTDSRTARGMEMMIIAVYIYPLWRAWFPFAR